MFRRCQFCHSPLIQTVRRINIRKRQNIDPDAEKHLPEFVYARENSVPGNTLYATGYIRSGALGVPNLFTKKMKVPLRYIHRPLRIPFAENNKVVDFACGYGFSVMAAQRKKFHIFGTGNCEDSQIGSHIKNGKQMKLIYSPFPIELPLEEGTKIKKVACGRAHTIVSSNNGQVWTFGNNSYGQCGRPIIPNEDYSVQPYFYKIPTFTGQEIEQIECGQDTSYILSNGVIYSSGLSADGQTGRETFENVDNFGPIEGELKGEKVIKVSCKGDCALALTEKGDVFGWGNSEYRQLALATEEQQCATPSRLLLNIGKVIDIAASGTACFALTENGTVFSWGYGLLGRGPDNNFSDTPKLIPSTLLGRNLIDQSCKVQKIFCGSTMAAAITNNGGLFTWGRNNNGILGLGHSNVQTFPFRVCVPKVLRVSCGVDHMFILSSRPV